jgi:hypothetical protein
MDRSDWLDEIHFISDAAVSNRVLVILDFDVAIQETYLLPSLHTWLASLPPSSTNRIVLAPSTESMRDVSPRVVEFATVLELDTRWAEGIEKAAAELDSAGVEDWAARLPVSANKFQTTRNREHETHIRQLALNCGSEIPAEVACRFVSITTGLSEHVSHSRSVEIASAASLLPWIRLDRGEGMARILEEALRTTIGGVGG